MKGFLVLCLGAAIGAGVYFSYEHPKDAEVYARKGAAAAGSAMSSAGDAVQKGATQAK